MTNIFESHLILYAFILNLKDSNLINQLSLGYLDKHLKFKPVVSLNVCRYSYGSERTRWILYV